MMMINITSKMILLELLFEERKKEIILKLSLWLFLTANEFSTAKFIHSHQDSCDCYQNDVIMVYKIALTRKVQNYL